MVVEFVRQQVSPDLFDFHSLWPIIYENSNQVVIEEVAYIGYYKVTFEEGHVSSISHSGP